MEALQRATRQLGVEGAGRHVIGAEIIEHSAGNGGLADPALLRAYDDTAGFAMESLHGTPLRSASDPESAIGNVHACFGREHGRDEGEFDSLDDG